MITDERDVERIVKANLERQGWARHWGAHGNTIDWYAHKVFRGEEYILLLEAKGDVGSSVANPGGQRLKYIQHALGQIVARTGPREYGYGPRTILGVAFPETCRDGSCYFQETLRAKIGEEFRATIRLCYFFVSADGQVKQDIPAAIDPELFATQDHTPVA